MELYRYRLIYYHYIKNTKKHNESYNVILTDPMGMLRRHFFRHTNKPWEGETLALNIVLTQTRKNWKTLIGQGSPYQLLQKSLGT